MHFQNTLTKQDIVLDMILQYKTRPPTTKPQSSRNMADSNKHHGVDGYLREDFQEKGFEWAFYHCITDEKGNFEDKDFDEYLVEQVHGHDIHFWAKLHELHENEYYWESDQDGFTKPNELGNAYVGEILEEVVQPFVSKPTEPGEVSIPESGPSKDIGF